jgi:hypothetical protein
MPGPVLVCSDSMFQELVPVVMTVVNDAASLGKATCPTAAEKKYIYGSCCQQERHCKKLFFNETEYIRAPQEFFNFLIFLSNV